MQNKSAVLGLSAVIATAFCRLPAQAQLSNLMQNMGGSSVPGMSSLGGSAVPSVGSASPTNLAGVLQYCVQNNDLGGGSASSATSVKESLLSKFTGSSAAPSSDSGYSAGSNGILDTGNGQTASLGGASLGGASLGGASLGGASLGGGGLKAAVTQKLCGAVLNHAKSML